jgi:hypothetical protein
MPPRHTWLLLLLLDLAASEVSAQRPGTTMQLPTYSFFSTSTTVSVPDRGGAHLGGVDRAADGRNEFATPLLPFRPFRNTAIGSERSATGAHVSVFIHDFEAMDKQLLRTGASTSRGLSRFTRDHASHGARNGTVPFPNAGTAPGPGTAVAASRATRPRAPVVSPSWSLASSSDAGRQAVMGVAEARARRAAQEVARRDEAASLFARAEQAAADGKTGVAKIYYQMAARRATGDLKQHALARLDTLGTRPAATQVARSEP